MEAIFHLIGDNSSMQRFMWMSERYPVQRFENLRNLCSHLPSFEGLAILDSREKLDWKAVPFLCRHMIVFVQSRPNDYVPPDIYTVSSNQFMAKWAEIEKKFLRSCPMTYRDLIWNGKEKSLSIDPHIAICNLTKKEEQLIRMFLRNPCQVIPRENICREVWHQVTVAPRTIDSQISRLRSRLRDSECEIESVYGEGYILR